VKTVFGAVVLLLVAAGTSWAQGVRQSDEPATIAAPPAAPELPAGYVIGADDVLTVVYWREKDMSAEVTVRPDGKVALPLLHDLHAAGLTPEAFREVVATAARRFVEDPNPTVMVKEIKSRRVFITGQVEKPGPYQLNHQVTVLQLIAMAGGLKEFSRGKNISVIRSENGTPVVHRFNYQEALNRKNLQQNIELKPGDTVLVP
jgi:polysaccharide export outer membrane protein